MSPMNDLVSVSVIDQSPAAGVTSWKEQAVLGETVLLLILSPDPLAVLPAHYGKNPQALAHHGNRGLLDHWFSPGGVILTSFFTSPYQVTTRVFTKLRTLADCLEAVCQLCSNMLLTCY